MATAPTCRSCWLATLPKADRQRIAAEPLTTSVYLCPGHQEQEDAILRDLGPLLIVDRGPVDVGFPRWTTS